MKNRQRKNEWADFWTGRYHRTHFSIGINTVLCRRNADGGSMGFHHTQNSKEVTCRTCIKLLKKQ